MDKLFDLNNPVMQFLDKVGKLMLLNLIFLTCSLPVVTIGAALTAMHKVTQGMALNQDPYIAKTFFRAFCENFKKATVVWMVVLAFAAAVCLSYFVTISYLGGGTAQICQYLLLAAAVVILSITSYLFPLIARYENDIKTQLLNASILAIGRLPRTILITACSAVPFAMLFCSVGFLAKTAILWVLIGFSLLSYLTSTLLIPVFRTYESMENCQQN